ncbi:hypothetical protein CDD80_7271 [Ophiocordyceps camponoti-rufipedis]|uniref:DUF221-domain-containing protein n=1 Tax=Ophiocordyceps camponoti-rufipedis TaxID=2004952 RepID=A0A2C5YMN3_9HYPO|nr:hypothetical protein CDD80_7271 [Ophiocordyceps camponoti-rufipedis]
MVSFIDWLKENLSKGPDSDKKDSQPESISGMVATLVPTLIPALAFLLVFLFFRRSQRRFYAPRTYLGSLPHNERSPDLPGGWLNWIVPFAKIPDVYALTHQGIDSYLFLRYLRVATTIALVSLLITWPILFPINATGGGTATQLGILSYSNISLANKDRLYAHAFVAWLVYGFVLYMIMRECIFYINLRQAYLLTPQYSRRISSRTVLFTAVPTDYLDEARIRAMFRNTVRRVWIVGQSDHLTEVVDERDKVAMKMEKAQVNLIKMVNKARVKAASKNPDVSVVPADADNVAARYVPDKKRPSHRTGPLGLVGKKVDTIDWCRGELRRLIPEAQRGQEEWRAGKYDPVRAVFVEFETQADAQSAYQTLTHHRALRMCPKVVGVKPSEVVWKSLEIPWWQVVIRRYAVYAFISALILFWAIPVAIIGLITQVNTLKQLPGLGWIGSIPAPILGVVSGLLPAVALSIVLSLVPVVMRWCAKLAGAPTLSRAELFTQNAYFAFQVIQVFLVQTVFSSGIAALLDIAANPSSISSILGQQLPTSSNFYISYFIVQGITVATGVVTQVIGLVVFRVLYKFLASTPRAMYTKWTTLTPVLWGSLMPVYTNIVCISIIFSVIAPLMLFWSTLALFLFHLAYRYNILFVSQTAVDTQGLIYPRALKQLFTGIYLAEICMIGLFAAVTAAGPAVLMAIFLVFTILFQITLFKNLNPLLYGLPRSVQATEHVIRTASRTEPDGTVKAGEDGKTATLSREQSHGSVAQKEARGKAIMRFFKPWRYARYETLRDMMPREEDLGFDRLYTEETEATAYLPPSVSRQPPTIWIPEDAAGVSKQEIALTSKVISITDEGASLDDKNHIVWDTEGARPPVWDERVLSSASACGENTPNTTCHGRDTALVLSQSRLLALDYGSGAEFEAGSRLPSVGDDATPFADAKAVGAARAADGQLLVLAGDCRAASSPTVWTWDPDGRDREWVRGSVGGGEGQDGVAPPMVMGATLAFSSTLAPVMDRPSIYSYGGVCFTDEDDDGFDENWQASGNYSKTMRRLTPDGDQGYVVGTAAASSPRTAMAGFSLTALPTSATNTSGTVTQRASFVLLGGHTSTAFINMSTAAVWSLPEETWTYVSISGDAPDSRSGHSCVVSADGRDLVVLGGWVGDERTVARPQLVVLRRGGSGAYSEWRWVSEMQRQGEEEGVFGHGAALLPGNVMVVYGGRKIGHGQGEEDEMGLRFLNLSSMEWLSSYRYDRARMHVEPSAPELTGSGPSVRRLGLGLGLGLGLALILALLIALCAWTQHRRRRRHHRRQLRGHLDAQAHGIDTDAFSWRRKQAYGAVPARKPLPSEARFDAFMSPPGVIHPILEEVPASDDEVGDDEDPFASPARRLDPEVREWVEARVGTQGLLMLPREPSPDGHSPSSSSYNTARSAGFTALQAEGPTLLPPRRNSSDSSEPSSPNKTRNSPPRRSWFGSLRRVFSVSESSSSPEPIRHRPSLDRATSDMGELLRRRQGRGDWEEGGGGEWDIERAAERRRRF